MKVEWKVDPAIQREAWGPIQSVTDKVSAMHPGASLVLDIGGGAGWFGLHLASQHPSARVISVDIVPRLGKEKVQHIAGSALDVPIKDGQADIVGANAILHHVPDHLDKAMGEVARLLKPGGLFLAQEPLADNPVARWTRGFVKTTAHEEGERPLSFSTMETAIKKQGLAIQKVEFYFITSYLMPHLVPRLPMKGLFRKIALFMVRFDRKVLSAFPKCRKYAAYVSIVARK